MSQPAIMSDVASDLDCGHPASGRIRTGTRFGIAGAVALIAVMFSSAVMVGAGQAVVITEFGAPTRVLTAPGLAWKLPAPLAAEVPVDLRLRTTSGGLQDVGTKDGLRVLVQAYVAWSVPAKPDRIRQYLRAGGNNPDEVARQLRSLLGSALQVTASDFALSDLVNTDPGRVRLDRFENELAAMLRRQALDIYGVSIGQVGVERLSLPAETLSATVARMRAERETVAAERTAEGLREAAAIRSDALRDSRIIAAKAGADAAGIEAAAREQAAAIYAASYTRDPGLYTTLRSLDTVGGVIGHNTRLILRTDTPPFNVLVDPAAGAPPAPAPAAAR